VQFDAWLEANSIDTTRWGDGEYTDPAAHNYWRAWQAALAARQPVGEPAMYQVRPRRFPAGEGWREVSKRGFDDRGDFPGYPEAEWERRALYAAPPAQAVDLGRIRSTVQALLNWIDDWAETPEESGVDAIEIEAAAVLALIDSQGVGNG